MQCFLEILLLSKENGTFVSVSNQDFQFPFKPGEESFHIMSSVLVAVSSMTVEKGSSAN
jgi:hypothetical protein